MYEWRNQYGLYDRYCYKRKIAAKVNRIAAIRVVCSMNVHGKQRYEQQCSDPQRQCCEKWRHRRTVVRDRIQSIFLQYDRLREEGVFLLGIVLKQIDSSFKLPTFSSSRMPASSLPPSSKPLAASFTIFSTLGIVWFASARTDCAAAAACRSPC